MSETLQLEVATLIVDTLNLDNAPEEIVPDQPLFREGLGQGPANAYLDLRLQAARRMVIDTRHSMREIALRCGFVDPTSFSRAFRRRSGISPNRVRGMRSK